MASRAFGNNGGRSGRVWVLLGLAGFALVGAYAFWSLRRPVVETTRVMRGPVVAAFYSTGTVSPEREYPIRAQVTGVVIEMKVDKGSKVSRGDLLAVVEDPRLLQSLATAEAQSREAEALADEETSPAVAELDVQLVASTSLLEIAQREYDRMVKMRELNAASASDLDRSIDRIKQLTSEKGSLSARRSTMLLSMRRQAEVARAAVASAKAELAKQSVVSPIDGVVLDRPTPFGTRVDAVMSNHLMTLADVRQEKLIMRAQVDEEDVARVTPGQAVKMTLYAFGSEVITGHVRRVYDKADEARRTFEVDVAIDPGDRRLSPGMTGELAFIVSEKLDTDILPSQAVQVRIRPRREGEPAQTGLAMSAAEAEQRDEVREQVVWTVVEGRLQPRVVRIGLRSIERVEVLADRESGLTPLKGLDVVLTGVDGRTKEGTPVRTRTRQTAGVSEPPKTPTATSNLPPAASR